MALDDTEQKLFEFLAAEFEANLQSSPTPQAALAKGIVDRFKSSPDTMTKGDVFALEMIILDLQPTERLVQRTGGLRVKYLELAGAKLAAAYRPVPFPPPDKYDDPAARRPLLADLQQLLGFLHWSYFFTPIREKIRQAIIRSAIGSMVVYTIIWAAACVLLSTFSYNFYGVMATVVYAGLMGGFISSQRRMQMIPTEGDPLNSIYELENGKYFLWFAPLTGAVFAVILMLLFIGGVLQGKIFPAFSLLEAATGEATSQRWYFTWQLLPKTSADYALLFLWSFIAGFAERFVPDALDRLISRAEAPATPTVQSSPAASASHATAEREGEQKKEATATPKPTINSVIPSSAVIGKEVKLTVRGVNFQSGATASLRDDAGKPVAAKLEYKDSNSVLVTCTPTGTKAYSSTLTITNPDAYAATVPFAVTAVG